MVRHLGRASAVLVVTLLWVGSLSAADQKKLNDEANAFRLADVINTSTADSEVGDGTHMTGLRSMTAAEEAQSRNNARVVQKIRLNKIGFARINEERTKKKLKHLVAGQDVDVAPVGEEVDLSAPGGGTPTATGGTGSAPAAGAPAATPSYVDNSTLMYFPPIRNQGSLGSCGQWAGAYYNMTHEVAMARGWNAKSGGDTYRYTPMFSYNFVNGGSGNNGSLSEEAWDIAQIHGLPRWSDFYTTSAQAWCTNPAVYRSALADRVASYSYITDVNTSTGLANLKAHLANGHTAVYYTYVNSWVNNYIGNDPSTTADDAFVGKKIACSVSGTNGGHAMTIVGYNDDIWCDVNGNGLVEANEKGALRIANSWGTGWLEGGYSWIAYSALSNGIFWNNRVMFVNPLPQTHVPSVVAKVTINHNLRNQVSASVGIGSVGASTPATTVLKQIVSYQGGSYAFSGAAAASQDFTYYLDFTDIAPSIGTAKRWFVQGTDNGANNGDLTIKSFELYYTGGGTDQLVGVASNTPKVANGNTQYAWIDWTMGNVAPFVTWTTASQASANESGTQTVTAMLSQAQGQNLTVPFTVSGTATNGTDYTLSSNSISIPAGATTGSVTINIIGDTLHEQNGETVVFNMGTPSLPGVVAASITLHTAKITDDDNIAPMVNAGPDRTVFPTLTKVPGLCYGTVTGSMNVTTPNPKTAVITNVSQYTEDAIADNTTEIYTGQIFDADGKISFTEDIDDSARIWIDGVLVLSSDNYWDRVSTANLNLTPGWHNIEIRIGNGGGGSGPYASPGIGFDPNGGTAWRTLDDSGNGSLLCTDGCSINLDGTVSDGNNDPVTTTWKFVSGPLLSAIQNPSALNTTASLPGISYGVYTFRLTGDDGYGPVSDDVLITLAPNPTVTWTTASQASTNESGTLTVTAQLSAAYTKTVTVPFTVTGTATSGTDYTITASPITIPAGATTGTVTIAITPDTIHELNNETVILTMGTPTNATLGATTVHTATITDDDNAAPMVSAVAPPAVTLSSGMVPWTPASLSPAAWYDGSTATINAGMVSVVNAGSQGGTISGPASLAAGGIGSLQAVQFNGTSQYLTGDYTNTGTTMAAFFVGKSLNSSQSAYAGMMSVWTTGAVNDWDNAGSAVLFNQNNTSANSIYTHRNGALSSSTGTLTTAFLADTIFDGSTDTLYLNGTPAAGVASTGSFNAGKVQLGARWTTSAFNTWWNGNFGEAIICNASLSVADRQKIEGYLAHKWGLTASLPADHPYKSAAPMVPGVCATANLDGTVSDPDGDPLTTTWTVVSKPAGSTVAFGAASAVDTTAIFTTEGVYTLRLTATDTRAQAFADVVITVVSGSNAAPMVSAVAPPTVILSSVNVPWTPASMATAAWYDAADATTITAAGGAVSQWNDKSGKGVHLKQGTASLQPATGSTINSLNAINFTGDMMATASNPFGATINNALVIAVHKVDSIANGTLFSLTGTFTNANRWSSHAPYGDGILYFDCGGVASPTRVNASYGVSAGSVVLSSFYCSTTDNVQQVYKNGNLLVGDSSGHAVSTAGNITVGGLDTSYQDTTLGEFIIINGTVDAATRQKLEGYLAHKWGLTANLPAGHPYKSAAPMVSGAGAIANLDGTVSDPDGDPLTTTWTVVSAPAGSTVAFGNASAVDTTATFTALGTYTLRLTATDLRAQAFADVVITVVSGSSNAAPTVATAAQASPNPVTGTTTALSVLGADDGGEAALTYTWATTGTPPAPVTFSANGTNAAKSSTATFTKAGSYSLQVTVKDAGNLTVTSGVTVTVNQTLASVAVSPSSATVHAGTTQQFSASANDQFGAAMTASFAWTVSGGGTISSTGLFTAGTTAGGPYTVTASASGKSGTAAVSVANTPPIAMAGTVTTDQGVPAGITLMALDADNDPLTYTIVTGPAHGTLTFGVVPDLIYIPAAGFSGADSFTFKVNDGRVDSNTATVTITVNHVNTAPAITSGPWVDTNPVVLPGTTAAHVVASDVDGDTLMYTWSQVSGPGTATFTPNGTTLSDDTVVSFSAAGSYVLKVSVSDGAASTTGTVAVTVNSGNTSAPPVAGYSRWFDASKITGVANGGAVSTWQDLSGNNAHATVPTGNAAPVYVANAGTGSGLGALYFAGNSGASNSAALRFASDGSIRTVFSVFKGCSFLLTAASTYDFHRPSNTNAADPLWVSTYASANIKNGKTYVNGAQVNGTTFAMPTSLHNGFNLVEVVTTGVVTADSFNKDRTYHAGNQYQAEVIIYDRVLTEAERLAVENYLSAKWFSTTSNTAPVATNGSVTTDQGVAVPVNLNASDADGNALTYSIVTGPSHGTLGGTAPNLTYTPAAGFFGTDSFTFKVNDGTVDSNTAAVTITVNHVNTPPTITSGPAVDTNPVVLPGTTAAHVVASDVDGDTLMYTWSLVSGPGTATFTPNGTTLSADTVVSFSAAGSYVLQVSVSDGTASTTGTVAVTVQSAVTQLWTPASITTAAWYDAADASTIVQSGGTVSQWNDKSGNGRHVRQASASNQPYYNATGFNGKPMIHTGGTQSKVLAGNSRFATSGAGVVAVYRKTGNGSNNSSASRFVEISGSTVSGEADKVGWSQGLFVGEDYTVPTTGWKIAVTGNANQVWAGSYIGIFSTLNHNGTAPYYATSAAVSSKYNGVGEIAEVIVLARVLSADEQAKLEGYLAWKWGLQANLPAGHPYKNAAPTLP